MATSLCHLHFNGTESIYASYNRRYQYCIKPNRPFLVITGPRLTTPTGLFVTRLQVCTAGACVCSPVSSPARRLKAQLMYCRLQQHSLAETPASRQHSFTVDLTHHYGKRSNSQGVQSHPMYRSGSYQAVIRQFVDAAWYGQLLRKTLLTEGKSLSVLIQLLVF